MKRMMALAGAVCLTVSIALAATALEEATPDEASPTPVPQATQEPAPTQTPEQTQEPAPTQTPEQTPEPAPTQTPEQTQEPAPTQTPEQTPEPTPTQTPEQTQEPIPTQTPETIQASIQAAGVYKEGTVSELVTWYLEGQYKEATIYIRIRDVIALANRTVQELETITFEPDRNFIPDERDRVIVSGTNPSGNGRENTVYIWIGRIDTQTPAPVAPTAPVQSTPEPPQADKGMHSVGKGGGMPSKGTVSRSVPHAKSTQTSIVAYDGVELAVSDESMTVLEMGGEQLDVTLQTGREAGCFTAQLLSRDEQETPDTLLLQAELTQDEAEYTWAFTGRTIKTLAASGIQYVALSVNGQTVALSTAGFTAGKAYTLLRTQGVPSKAFAYTVRMTGEETAQPDIGVSVEGKTYMLTEDRAGEMYFYDLYAGGRTLLDEPLARGGNKME